MRRWILVLALLLAAPSALADGLAALRGGNEAYRAGELEQAVNAFTRAIADRTLTPEALAIAYNNRGVVYDDLGDYDRAISDYEAALALRPDHATTARNLALAFANRGYAHHMLGDHEAALADYAVAIETNPDEPVAYFRRSLARIEAGERAAALADLETVLRLDPAHREAQAARERLVAELGGEPPRETAVADGDPEPAAAGEGSPGRINTAVNFRAGPSNDDRVQGVLQQGQQVRIVGEVRGWLHLETADGQRGYVFGRFVDRQ